MKAMENEITKEGARWEDFCYAQSVDDSTCHDTDSYFSPLKVFSDYDIDTLTTSQMEAALAVLRDDDQKWADYKMYFDKDYDRDTFFGFRSRAIFVFGAPIEHKGKRYVTEVEDNQEQQEIVAAY